MAEVEITKSARGFEWYGEPVLTDYGHKVSVYESSAFGMAHCWLRIEKDTYKGPGDLPLCDEAAHMTVEQAMAVRDRLNVFIERHQ